MDIRWVKIVAWHALLPHEHGVPSTYCGRKLVGIEPVSDELPAGKSCELCLRIVSRLNDESAA